MNQSVKQLLGILLGLMLMLGIMVALTVSAQAKEYNAEEIPVGEPIVLQKGDTINNTDMSVIFYPDCYYPYTADGVSGSISYEDYFDNVTSVQINESNEMVVTAKFYNSNDPQKTFVLSLLGDNWVVAKAVREIHTYTQYGEIYPSSKLVIVLDNTISVTLSGGSNATANPETGISQTGLTGDMTTVTYTAINGAKFPETSDCYFSRPNNYKTFNGIRVVRTSDTVLTVYGTPTANTTIQIPDAVHAHSFTYEANSTTITASCTESCDITDGLTLTINAPTGSLVYDGTTTYPATLSTGYNTTAFPDTYTISYTKDGAVYTGTPTEAGSYTASVTVDTATASVNYTIAPAAIASVAITDIDAPVAGTELDTAATTSTTNVTLGTVTWDPTTTPAAYITQYTSSVTATATENYTFTDATTATVNGQTAMTQLNDDGTLTIRYQFPRTALTPVTITAEDQEISYSSQAIAIPVNGMFNIPEDAGEESYSVGKDGDTGEGTFAEGQLTVTKCGTFTVTLKTNATETHAEAEISATLTVVPAAVTITAKNQMIFVGGTVPTLVGEDFYTISGLFGEDALTTSPTLAYQKNGQAADPDNTVPGTYNIVPSGASAGDNYAINYTNGTLTITDKNIQTITAEDMTVTYGDTGRSVSAIADGGGTLSFAVTSGDAVTVDETTGELTIVKVGTATVTVTAAETDTYAAATIDVTVTVNKVEALLIHVPTPNDRSYDGTKQPLLHNDGIAGNGTLKYALGDANGPTGEYTTSIPTAAEAGTYYVWVKVVGDDNHMDKAPVCVKVTINEGKSSYVVAFVDNHVHEIGDRKDCRIIVRSEPDESKAYDNYLNARMDATVMPNGSHTAEKGSLILILKDTYLDTLAIGKHKVTINFKDGSVDAEITIKKGYEVPKTGDGANPMLWLGLMLLGLLAAGVIMMSGKMRNIQK